MLNKNICFATLFMLLSATATISIGYTQLVQAEIKDDISDLRKQNEIKSEKITSIQITQAEIRSDVKSILRYLENIPPISLES